MRWIELVLQIFVSMVKKLPDLISGIAATICIMSIGYLTSGKTVFVIPLIVYAVIGIGILVLNRYFDIIGDKLMNGLSLLSKPEKAPLKEGGIKILIITAVSMLIFAGICLLCGFTATNLYRVCTFGMKIPVNHTVNDMASVLMVIYFGQYIKGSLDETARFMQKDYHFVDKNQVA